MRRLKVNTLEEMEKQLLFYNSEEECSVSYSIKACNSLKISLQIYNVSFYFIIEELLDSNRTESETTFLKRPTVPGLIILPCRDGNSHGFPSLARVLAKKKRRR